MWSGDRTTLSQSSDVRTGRLPSTRTIFGGVLVGTRRKVTLRPFPGSSLLCVPGRIRREIEGLGAHSVPDDQGTLSHRSTGVLLGGESPRFSGTSPEKVGDLSRHRRPSTLGSGRTYGGLVPRVRESGPSGRYADSSSLTPVQEGKCRLDLRWVREDQSGRSQGRRVRCEGGRSVEVRCK